ncbi:MAG: glycosyltransferase [Candidatus Binatia bacterium]
MVRSLGGGGMERVVTALAAGFAARGHQTTLLVGVADGALTDAVTEPVPLVPLHAASQLRARAWALAADPSGAPAMLPLLLGAAPRMLRHLPGLVHRLRTERPDVLLTAGTQSNLTALWAQRFAGITTRVVISEHNTLSAVAAHAKRRFRRAYPVLARRNYGRADAIIAVSKGVADDLSRTAGIPRQRIITIYNPVVSAELLAKARAPLDHPWLTAGAPPVVLGVGRLHRAKDFPNLIRAFARVRAVQPARLVILGDGEERAKIETLSRSLGVAADVALPGYAENPFAWMARASVFVLCSTWEGFGNVLVEALACGCPVVSTDCPHGPAEILDGGTFGPLVPVGDDRALADAILAVLRKPVSPNRLRARAAMCDRDTSVNRYLDVLI